MDINIEEAQQLINEWERRARMVPSDAWFMATQRCIDDLKKLIEKKQEQK